MKSSCCASDQHFFRWRVFVATLLIIAHCGTFPANANETHQHGTRKVAAQHSSGSLSQSKFTWPTSQEFLRVLSLQDFTVRVVLSGTVLLGLCAGIVGTFMLLRKRSLVGDVIGHASLPGIAIAFLVMELLHPGSGKSLPGLLLGAMISGTLGMLCTVAIHRYTRIKQDAALAIVLSVFFGAGIALFTVIQDIPSGAQAGLHQFIYGKAASLSTADVRLIASGSIMVILVSILFFKEFAILCFDEQFASSQGWPVLGLDILLMGLVTGVSVIGLQSVGLLLVVAMLLMPAASARFWTDRLRPLAVIAGTMGALTAGLGVIASALFPRLAAGAVIVLVGSLFFALSMLFGRRRGMLLRWSMTAQLRQRVGRQHLLRALFEFGETASTENTSTNAEPLAPIKFETLLGMRSWAPRQLRRILASNRRQGLVLQDSNGSYGLTPDGMREATQVVRNHRLWETYLIHYADIAPSHVDRDADQIEHILEPDLLNELERLLAAEFPNRTVPPSPHQLN